MEIQEYSPEKAGLRIPWISELEMDFDNIKLCRFILSMSIALGLGTTLVPGWATNHLWPIVPSMSSGLRGFRSATFLSLYMPLVHPQSIRASPVAMPLLF